MTTKQEPVQLVLSRSTAETLVKLLKGHIFDNQGGIQRKLAPGDLPALGALLCALEKATNEDAA